MNADDPDVDIDWDALDEELEANLDEYMVEWRASLEEAMQKKDK